VIARSPEEVAHKREVLRRYCAQAGCDPGEVATSVLYTGDPLAIGNHDRFIDEMRPYARLGVETVIVIPFAADPVAFVQRLGRDIIPRLGEL
jgi:alkanesulfonate monooxygenase SsuD/methylene tetrahydromethanopterin reductase-like flavin-dependent oxidoreductase (luciferase family)